MSKLNILAKPFQFETLNVYTAVDENSDVWFCVKDVCSVLEITGSEAALENIPENWLSLLKLNTIRGERETHFINVAGFYRLIFSSNNPKAEEFAAWVGKKVFPQIRQHRFFRVLPPKDYLDVVSQIAELSAKLTAARNAFNHALLVNALRNLCNMADIPMPDVQLLAQEVKPEDLFLNAGNEVSSHV